MSLLRTYQDFINRVDELGIMTLSQTIKSLTSLGREADPAAWHTGDPASDPWLWKDQAAQEKRLAYACCLGRAKGFIVPRPYPLCPGKIINDLAIRCPHFVDYKE